MVPSTPWARIERHKVLQWSVAYLGAALALAHGQELLAHAFHWPEVIGRLLMGALVVGFPVAIVLAWYHGHKGMKHIGASEMTALAVLLLTGGVVLTWLARTGHSGTNDSDSLRTGTKPGITTASAAGPHAATRRVRLAMLPLENLSPDPANAFFADGLHEDIISALAARVPDLEVISRTTMMIYRASPKPIASVARELAATHVIEGSVRREGDRVRLTLQLIDGATDTHIWAQTYDRTLKDALTLQSDVAQQVVSQLAVKLPPGTRPGAPPATDPEAYDLYLKARLIRKQINPISLLADIERVHSLLTRAIARDPRFATAYIERANHTLDCYLANIGDMQASLRLVRSDLDAAERIAPDDATRQATEALYRYTMRTDDSVQPLVEAIEARGIDPMNLYFVVVALFQAGHVEASLAALRRWTDLDPANINLGQLYANQLALARKPLESLRIFDAANRRADADFFAVERGYTLFAYTGRSDEWRAAIDRQASIVAIDIRIARESDALRFERRYEDLERVLDESPMDSTGEIWGKTINGYLGIGRSPLAEKRGWAALLVKDATSAAAAGRALQLFVTSAPKLPTNDWHLCTLAAEARLFSGHRAAAIRAANECLALDPRERGVLTWRMVAITAAAVLAWAGDEAHAVDILERLSNVIAGLGPAEITRDPLYTVPLAHNARFQRLVSRLEMQMQENKLDDVGATPVKRTLGHNDNSDGVAHVQKSASPNG